MYLCYKEQIASQNCMHISLRARHYCPSVMDTLCNIDKVQSYNHR